MLNLFRGLMFLLFPLLFYSIWSSKELNDFVFPSETSYYNDYKSICTGGMDEEGVYLVNKYHPDCALYSTNRNIRIVPLLFTASLGSSLVELGDKLASRGFGVTNVSYEIGADATLGWFRLFEPNPFSVVSKRYSYGEDLKSNKVENVLFKKIVHQISDPLQTVEEGRKFCGEDEVWKFVSLVTPYINFYLSASSTLPGSDACIHLLMYHWWSWNGVLHSLSDYTYITEKVEFISVCRSSFKEYPDLVRRCMRANTTVRKDLVNKDKSSKVLRAEALYRIDCELANRIFYSSIEYGYVSYESVIRKCGSPEGG